MPKAAIQRFKVEGEGNPGLGVAMASNGGIFIFPQSDLIISNMLMPDEARELRDWLNENIKD